MSRLTKIQNKHSLECLRLAADCRNLAWIVRSPDQTKGFLKMADFWTALAHQALESLDTSSEKILPGR